MRIFAAFAPYASRAECDSSVTSASYRRADDVPTVVLLGTLETKGAETLFVGERVFQLQHVVPSRRLGAAGLAD